MEVLVLIVMNVILPVFTMIGVGVFLHRKFTLNMDTLSKLNHYFLLPAVSFVNIYQSSLQGSTLVQIMGFLLLQSASLIALSSGIARLASFEPRLSATFKNSVVLNNSGNFGLPVSQLVFHQNPYGASIQVIVTIFQNLLTYTYGLFNSVSTQANGKKMIAEFLKLPTLYTLILGLCLNSMSIQLPQFIWSPIQNASNAFIAIALITLGAQSAYLKITQFSLPLILSLVGRLVMSPMIALLILYCLRLEGTVAQALLIASSYPTSRNSALFALEYNNHPDYAAQVVLVSTLISSLTVTLVVYGSKFLV